MAPRRSARVAAVNIPLSLASKSFSSAAMYGKASKPIVSPTKRKATASTPSCLRSPTNELSKETTPSAVLPAPALSDTSSLKRRKKEAPTAKPSPDVLCPSHQDHLFDTLHALPSKTHLLQKAELVDSFGALPAIGTDVDSLLQDAEAFLIKTDEKLRTVIELHRCALFSPEKLKEVVYPFTALSSGIIGQQVIFIHFLLLFPHTHSRTCARALSRSLSRNIRIQPRFNSCCEA